jgi:hypothetical protein
MFLLSNGRWEFCPWEQTSQSESGHSPACTVEFENVWSFTSLHSIHHCYGLILRYKSTFTSTEWQLNNKEREKNFYLDKENSSELSSGIYCRVK